MINNKIAQATVVIIIALIIGVTILGAYYTKEYILKSKFERQKEKSSLVPPQAQEIFDFTINCIKQTADEAVDLVGLQGGYIAPQHNPYESPVLDTPQTTTALWFFETPNKIQNIKIPEKATIQEQISDFIDQNLENCINSYQDFPDFQISYQEQKTESIIKANQVLIKTELPLIIKKQDFEFDFKPFYTEIKKPLGYLYEQAIEIIKTEQEENFLEKKTLNILTAYDEIPFRGSTDDCNAPFWLKDSVTSKLREYLQLNTAFLKIKNTNYQLTREEHKYFEIPTNIEDKELNINFQFLKSWPAIIEIFPEENGILKAESITESLGAARAIAESFTCMSIMNFIYNIKYPVLINLNKDNYNFRFATEVIIDRNEPKINPEVQESIPEPDTKFCNNKISNIELEVTDQNQNPIEYAEVKYKCINYICDVGITDNKGILNTKIMPCINGAIIATKQDYHPTKFTTSTNTDIALQIQLQKYHTLNIIPQIQRPGTGEPKENEQIIIQMQELEKEYSTSIIYPDQKQIKLIPGTYQTQIYLTSQHPEGLKIGDKKLEVCVEVPKKGAAGLLLQQTETKCETQKIEGFTVEQVISGSSEGTITITQSDLNKNSIKFYVPYKGIPQTIDQISQSTAEFTQPVFE